MEWSRSNGQDNMSRQEEKDKEQWAYFGKLFDFSDRKWLIRLVLNIDPIYF